MKIKIICAAVAAVIAVSTAVVAAAYGNSAKNEDNEPNVSAEQSIGTFEDGAYFYDSAGNKHILREGDVPGTVRDKDGNITYQYSDPLGNEVVEDGFPPDTAPVEYDDSYSAESVSVNAVSAIAGGVTWTGEFGKNVMPKIAYDRDNKDYKIKEDSEVIGFLREFFGCDGLPVDDIYKDNVKYNKGTGCIEFNLEKGAEAKSPVDGKVIGACGSSQFNNGLGNFIAVEFGNKIFMMAHLDSVSVKVGDEVTAGQTVGVCGGSGMVEYGKTQMHFFPMIKQ